VPILIDGHNLIGRLPSLSLQSSDDEEELVRLLQSYRARTGRAVTVVFDPGVAYAPPLARRYGGIEVVFVPHGSTADKAIVHRVQHSRDPHGCLVVTSDHELAATVKHEGARVQSADDFAAELAAPGDDTPDWKDAPPSPQDVAWWLSVFEDEN
jgi:predicted RNA-binding protein with PIN domain